MSDNNAELLRYEVFHFQGRYGGRIYEDGRYELYDNQAPGAEPEWEAFEPFTAEQMSEITPLVDAIINSISPEDIKQPSTVVPDSASAAFTLRDKRYAMYGYPFDAPAEFTQLLDRIAQLRKPSS